MTALVELIKTVNNKILEGKLMESPSLAFCKTEHGISPLGLASFFGNTEMVKILIDHGANPNMV